MSTTPKGIPINLVRNHPLVEGWLQIIAGLEETIDGGQIIDLVLLKNFYQLNVKADLDPKVVQNLQYIGVVVNTLQDEKT